MKRREVARTQERPVKYRNSTKVVSRHDIAGTGTQKERSPGGRKACLKTAKKGSGKVEVSLFLLWV